MWSRVCYNFSWLYTVFLVYMTAIQQLHNIEIKHLFITRQATFTTLLFVIFWVCKITSSGVLWVCPSRSYKWPFVPLNIHLAAWLTCYWLLLWKQLPAPRQSWQLPLPATRSVQFHADTTEHIHSHFCFRDQQTNRFGTCFWETVVSAADCDSGLQTQRWYHVTWSYYQFRHPPD